MHLNDTTFNQYPKYAGATCGAWLFDSQKKDNNLIRIENFVSKQGRGFENILRFKQLNNRYKYLTYIISDPKIAKKEYKNYRVIGLFYEDLQPSNDIRFKQDFVLTKDAIDYIFVIGENWLKTFPDLEQYSKYIWSFSVFKENIGKGNKYGKRKLLDHHYKNPEDLPLEISKQFQRGKFINLTSINK